ncbi:MAG: F0F1 ATP synthase subunit gamma [Candidatus Omnitrophica bacterium]|nr:F0F1 ATP synthase subunit gamma [Candidatus Omnitrophota bacterium]
MVPLIKLKKDVSFNSELTHVVDVLRGIATARYYVLERQLALFEPFFQAAEIILSAVPISQLMHPFVQARSKVTGVVMVTSDAGFLGGLNTQVVNMGLRQAAGGPLTVIGERGASYLRDLRKACTAFPGIEDASRFALASAVKDHVVGQCLSGECGRVAVVFPKPVSFSVQEVTTEVLLPCSSWVPEGRLSPDTIWESSMEEIVEYVVAHWIAHRLDETFALSRLAELAARAVHLENSYQELMRRGKKLRHEYFRARHEVIDRSMREIFSAQLLYRRLGEEKPVVVPDQVRGDRCEV